jgi:hypothetical protein
MPGQISAAVRNRPFLGPEGSACAGRLSCLTAVTCDPSINTKIDCPTSPMLTPCQQIEVSAGCLLRLSFAPHSAHSNVTSFSGPACMCAHLKHLIFGDFCGAFAPLDRAAFVDFCGELAR